jgi:hypothetical protein
MGLVRKSKDFVSYHLVLSGTRVTETSQDLMVPKVPKEECTILPGFRSPSMLGKVTAPSWVGCSRMVRLCVLSEEPRTQPVQSDTSPPHCDVDVPVTVAAAWPLACPQVG